VDIFLLGVVTCLAIVTVGYVVHKYLRMPWMFTVVVLGMVLSALGLFSGVVESAGFQLLSRLGMLLFLFTIGIDLELEQMRKLGSYVVVGGSLLVLTEGLLLGLFFYSAFPAFVSNSFVVALLCGIAFGTVGEVVLLAILKEFGLEKTSFGQLALGIGVFDDVFEIASLAMIIALPALTLNGSSSAAWKDSVAIMLSLCGLFVVAIVLSQVGKYTRRYLANVPNESFVIPFLIFLIIYCFIWLGSRWYADVAVVAAILSGVAVKQVLPEKFVQRYEHPLFFVCNIFLGPFFFLSLGSKMSLHDVLSQWPLVLAIIAISLLARISVSYLCFHKLLGKRQSVVMGVGLTAKFSTSVVSESLMMSSGLIAPALYSAIMAAFIVLKPAIVGVFSWSLAAIKDTVPRERADV